jgi:hypothetical protein
MAMPRPDLPKSTASRAQPRLVAVNAVHLPTSHCVHDTSIHFFLLSLLLLAEGLVRGLVHQVLDLAGLRELDLGEPTWASATVGRGARGAGAQMGGPCLRGSTRCAEVATPLAARSALTASLGLLVDEGGRVAERLVDLLDGARDGGVDVRRGLHRLDAANRLCMSAVISRHNLDKG